MTRDKIKEGDICTLDESVEYSYNPHKPYEVVVLWHGVNSQPLVTKLDTYKPFWVTYSQLIEVKRHIDLSIKVLEQQTCEDAVSRQAVLDIFADNADATRPYSTAWEKIRDLPSVNPQHAEAEIQKMQDLEQAEIQKAYELGKTEGQKSEDTIIRQAALGLFAQNADAVRPYSKTWEEVKALPSVNPQRTGHWIQTQEKDDAEPFILWECSECHKEFRGVVHKVSNFCPSCGCRIVEP